MVTDHTFLEWDMHTHIFCDAASPTFYMLHLSTLKSCSVVGVKIWTKEWWFPNYCMMYAIYWWLSATTSCYKLKAYGAPVQVSPRLKT